MTDATATFGYDGTLLNAGLRQQERTIKSSADRSEKAFAGLSTAIKSYFSISALSGIGEVIVAQLSRAGDIIDATERLQISAEEFQRLDFMGTKKGTDVETIVKAVERLNRSLADADDSDGVAKALRVLRVDAAQLAGMGPERQIHTLAGAFQDAEKRGEGFSEAYDLMGKSFGELLPLFRTTREELVKFSQVEVVSETQLRQLDMMDDRIETMMLALKKGGTNVLGWASNDLLQTMHNGFKKSEGWMDTGIFDLMGMEEPQWLKDYVDRDAIQQQIKDRDALAEQHRKSAAAKIEESKATGKLSEAESKSSSANNRAAAGKMKDELDLEMEVKRLKALAAGRKKAAEEIEREGQVMNRVIQLVEKGMDPGEANKLARQMQGWEDKANGRRRKVRGYSSKQGGHMMGGSVDDYNRLQAIELSGPNEGRYKYSSTYMGPSRSRPSRMMGGGLDEFHARNGTRGATAAGFTGTTGQAYNSTSATQAAGMQRQKAQSALGGDMGAKLDRIIALLQTGLA